MHLALITITSFALLLLVVEIVYRKQWLENEIARKVGHVLAGFLAIFFSYFLSFTAFIAISVIFAVGLLIAYKTKVLSAFISPKRLTYGMVTFPMGLAALAALLYRSKFLFISGILILSLSDSAAWLAGYNSRSKTTMGSVVFFLVTFFILLLFTELNWYFSFMISVLLAFVERYSFKGFDNLTIPIGYAVLITLVINKT